MPRRFPQHQPAPLLEGFLFFFRFFRLCHHQLRQNLLLVLAKKQGEYIAGSFNLKKGNKLYGRYWGCREPIPNLHFEF
ncbi:MAG: N-acetyltransferase [Deltaproteobacteria bacterium]|nr:N-acetyltransferase [Deltaproteobacteria bacterium]